LSSRESNFLPSSSSETGDVGKITHEEDNGPTVSDDERESEEEMLLPQTHSRQLSGQSPIEAQSSGSFQLPPFSILEQTRLKQMREEIASLRRTSAEAVSTSIRLSEQLANANLEVSRSREAVRYLEYMLQSETTKRTEAERLKDIEVERRRAAEALNRL
jgi:septal ring factor EnvC (AmiA/AmiB activator)